METETTISYTEILLPLYNFIISNMKRSLNKVHKDQQNIEFNETILLALVLRNYLHSIVLFNFNPFVPNANTADKSKISQNLRN